MLIIASIFIGILGGVFSSLIGGAARQIMVPLLLLMGLPPYVALSTPKMSAVGIAIGSFYKFSSTKYIKWSLVAVLMVFAVVAGIVGAGLLLKTPEHILNKIVSGLLIVSVLIMYIKKEMGVISVATSKFKRVIGYVFYFISEMMRAAFGSGFGFFTGIVLMYFFGLTILESIATKRVPGLIVSIVALMTFLTQGVIDIPIGVGLLVGGAIGSYVGTHYAVKIGDKWVKRLFTIFATGMAVALLF